MTVEAPLIIVELVRTVPPDGRATTELAATEEFAATEELAGSTGLEDWQPPKNWPEVMDWLDRASCLLEQKHERLECTNDEYRVLE